MDKATFVSLARQAGFGKMGFCSTREFDIERQHVMESPPIEERKQLRFVPEEDYPQAKSLAVLLWGYTPAANEENACVQVDGYYFASNAAYHAARELEAQVRAAGGFAQANVSYPAREAAVRAGMGIIGNNGLLITPEFGTRVVIILMATDIVNDENDHIAEQKEHCLRCEKCAKACPAGAIDSSGMHFPEKCIRNFMMEGVIAPEHLRAKMGMRLVGCDICQRVCPLQPQFTQGKQLGLTLDELMTANQTEFSQAIAKLSCEIGRNAARPQRVRAQAALLAGNSKNAKYLPVLREWAKLPFPAVSEHARWAIEQIGMSGLDRSNKTD